jgi:hypothetical protein
VRNRLSEPDGAGTVPADRDSKPNGGWSVDGQAFAGYARIATLGEEVREPARIIPRAIPLALGIIVVAIYATVGAAALAAVGPTAL